MASNTDLALETEGLSKTYKGLRARVQALYPLDLKLEAGHIFGLLGANGAGKSTLVKAVLGIVRPTTGRARIFGVDTRNPDSRRNVGYLPEGLAFPRYLSGRETCEYFGKLAGVTGARLKAEVDEKLKLVGMADWAARKVVKYSKGMKQRIGMAQALIGDPKLVILDEPTDGVDPVGRHELRDVIRALPARGTTVFLNSHMLSEVEAVCDQVAIMYRGRLLQRGPVSEITEKMSVRDGKMQLKFRLGPYQGALPAGFEGAEVRDGDVLVQVSNREETNTLIDRLRAAGIAIYEVQQWHASLEEAFLAIMEDGEHMGIGGVK